MVVVAAGNRGPEATRLDNPALDPRVLAVGASDPAATAGTKDDLVASFSSCGNAVRGADLVDPGRSIVGLPNPGSNVDLEHPLSVVADRVKKAAGAATPGGAASAQPFPPAPGLGTLGPVSRRRGRHRPGGRRRGWTCGPA